MQIKVKVKVMTYVSSFSLYFASLWYFAQADTLTTLLYHSEKLLAVLEVDQHGQLFYCNLDYMEKVIAKQPIITSWTAAGLDVRRLKFADMVDLIFKCKDLPSGHGLAMSRRKKENELKLPQLNIGILPDTKWCGFGAAAANYSDLGTEEELDRCCRAHDYCPVYSMRLSQDNPTLYTQVHCLCDQKFYQCLKNVGTSLADTVGQIFFNIVRMKCLNFVKDGKSCSLSVRGRCLRWESGGEGEGNSKLERSDERSPRIVITDNTLNY